VSKKWCEVIYFRRGISLDTESGFKDAVVINAAYGLGEMIVQGAVSPDEYIVFKPLLKDGFNAIIEKKLGQKIK
jgi:pyruvate,water dikinase